MYILCLLVLVKSAVSGGASGFQESKEVCVPPSIEGVNWILAQRHGWGQNLHRANIILAVKRWRFSNEEKDKISLQLERRITKMLLGNHSMPVSVTDLALYINALVATQKNPRNFRGVDLVRDLLARVNNNQDLHPFIAEALCNSRAVEFHHLDRIKKYTRGSKANLNVRELEMKAMALKALACSASLPGAKRFQLFAEAMQEAAEDLIKALQSNVTFNVYTTSLMYQALKGYGIDFDEEKALDYLRKESETDLNMVKAYYIEMALNSGSVKFLKDLYLGPYEIEQSSTMMTVTLSIKNQQEPEKDITVTIWVPRHWNLLQALDEGSALTNRLRYSYILENGRPTLIQVGQQPNDPEKGQFWIICRQASHSSEAQDVLQLEDGEHIILAFGPSECIPSE